MFGVVSASGPGEGGQIGGKQGVGVGLGARELNVFSISIHASAYLQ